MANEEPKSSIEVEITDESVLHCLKLVLRPRDFEQPLEIFLHTTQAINLVHKLSLAICERHRRDSSLLIEQTLRLSALGGVVESLNPPYVIGE